ncbi:hypothetical protein [Halosegnis longus]|uniref:hypothetical protein n=1 Tax=Halosegnis longus TaxID=2216012 RepID=UPI00096AB2EC|nr:MULTISPECIES: hypothetical protein [Halobacteriales]
MKFSDPEIRAVVMGRDIHSDPEAHLESLRQRLGGIRDEEIVTDGGIDQPASDDDRTDWSADRWETFLREHDAVLMLVDANHEIHHFEIDDGELVFLRGGSLGYDYQGSRAALEAFVDDDGPFRVVSEDEEAEMRRRLQDGEWATPTRWASV